MKMTPMQCQELVDISRIHIDELLENIIEKSIMPWREAYIEIKHPCDRKILKNGSLRKENNGVSSLSDPTVEAKSWVFAPEKRVSNL
jgi:hypothetical protein